RGRSTQPRTPRRTEQSSSTGPRTTHTTAPAVTAKRGCTSHAPARRTNRGDARHNPASSLFNMHSMLKDEGGRMKDEVKAELFLLHPSSFRLHPCFFSRLARKMQSSFLPHFFKRPRREGSLTLTTCRA